MIRGLPFGLRVWEALHLSPPSPPSLRAAAAQDHVLDDALLCRCAIWPLRD